MVKGANDVTFNHLSDLPAGTYFLHTEMNGTSAHHKLVKADK
jgi:hypothetical protein